MVKKNVDDVFSRFDTIPACDRQMDRQTDRHLATVVRAMRSIACLYCMSCTGASSDWQLTPFWQPALHE